MALVELQSEDQTYEGKYAKYMCACVVACVWVMCACGCACVVTVESEQISKVTSVFTF